MFSGDLWNKASNLIAQTLEQLDVEADKLLETQQHGDGSRTEDGDSTPVSVQTLQRDLETYKKLLDEAHMQQFELSKQSRLLVAERDARIQVLRQKCGEDNESESESEQDKKKKKPVDATAAFIAPEDEPTDAEKSVLFTRLVAEKHALEGSLCELETQLRESMRDKSALSALRRQYDELNTRFATLRDDYVSLKAEFDAKEREQAQTIDKLVEDYSLLAAENELAQRTHDARIQEVVRENEVLVTKMHALEHSISELADRSLSLSHTLSPTRSTATVTTTSQEEEGEHRVGEKEREREKEKEKEKEREADLQELRENRAKMVHLQFDVKERDDEIERLKNALNALSVERERATAAAEEREKERERAPAVDEELQSLRLTLTERERERALSVEREKAEREELEREKMRLQRLLEEREREREKEKEREKETDSRTQAEEEETERARESERERARERENELAAKTLALEERESALSARLIALQSERETERASHGEAISVLQSERETLRERVLSLERDAEREKERASQSASDEERERLERVRVLEERVSEKERERAALQRSLEEQAAESVTKTQALSAQWESEKTALGEELAKLREELQSARELLEKQKLSSAEELQKSLASQKSDLETSFSSSLSVEVAKARESVESALREEFSLREVQLAREALTQRERQRDELLAERERESATLRDMLQREKENALQDARALAQRELDASLSECERRKESEKTAALSALQREKDSERETLLATAQRERESERETLTAKHDQAMAVLQGELHRAQSEIAAMDTKYKGIIADELAKLETEKNAQLELAVAAARAELQLLVEKAYAERDEHLANYTKERVLRKKVHNRLLELQGNIRVICRVRPVLEVERRSGEDVDVTEIPNDEELIIQRDSQTRSKYEYDRVFGQRSTQEEVFDAVQPLCVSVLDGYNVCIFAYGQTGSGKTFTMQGYGDQHGVSPRAISELFNQVANMGSSWTYTLTLSMLEIYNETIRDLLDASGGQNKDKLEIRQAPEGNIVPGLTDVVITSPDQVRDLMKLGQTNRAVGSHDMNEHSSRSHSILTVTCRGRNTLDGATTFGKLHLIDLAGSERVSKTDATGDRLKEAQSINKSLSALGDVITALGNKKATHVPFRNSKLTYLLQDSLGGNSKVLTFVNISPAVYNLGETVCSLNFAARCRSTELGTAKKQTGAVPSTPSASVPSTPGGREEGESLARQLLREKKLNSTSLSMKR